MRRSASLAMLACVTFAWGWGCGDASGPRIPVYPVAGTVKYNGQPVVGADITFFNAEESRSAFGRTNDQGEYQLTTFSSNDGAIAGKHAVTIAKFEAPASPPALPDVESEAYTPPGLNQSTDPPRPKSTLPEKYGKQETSGLIAVVNVDGPNNVDFNLTD